MSTLSENLCSPEELRISAQRNAPSRCLSRNESIALAVRFPDALLDVEMLTPFAVRRAIRRIIAYRLRGRFCLYSGEPRYRLSCRNIVVTQGQRNIRYHAKKYPGQWRLIKVPMDVYLVRHYCIIVLP